MPGSLPDLFRSTIWDEFVDVKKKNFYHISCLFQGEKKVPYRGFFSSFLFFFLCLLLAGCAFFNGEENREKKIREKEELFRMKKVEDMRKIRLLIVENGEYELAYRAVLGAAEQLNLHVFLVMTLPEDVIPLLRAGKADLAFGIFLQQEELKRFQLEKYQILLPEKNGKNHPLSFLMGSGSRALWALLEKGMMTAVSNGRISFDVPLLKEEEEEKWQKVVGKKKKKKEEKKSLSGDKEVRKEKNISGKKNRRERLRARIFRDLQKMKKKKKE